MHKVLIIEDDPDILELVSIHLADLECNLTKAMDGTVGFGLANEHTYDLIILDIMLPGTDGLEICRKLRAREVLTPILMLTARSEEIDKVLGLEIGADDYLTKPFSIREFIARVKAIFRRVHLQERKPDDGGGTIQIENLQIDMGKRKVSIGRSRIDLTPKEYDLLLLLASHPGKSYSREDLLNAIWGYEFSGYEHTVNSHINRLRAKIEPDFSSPTYILTTWGVGYRFSDEIAIRKIKSSV